MTAFHYINDGHHLHCSHPTIETSEADPPYSPSAVTQSSGKGLNITAINYSPPFQAPLPIDTPPAFFSALAHYTTILNKESNRFTYLLQEGDAVVFDNRRVLHGRTAFVGKTVEADEPEGETDRWLKGCYLEEDAVHDKRRILSTKLEG